MNKKTWQSLGTDVQTAFEQAAQEAADQANTLSEASEKTYKEKLREVHMEIYKPSVQQFMLWKRPGEGIWRYCKRTGRPQCNEIAVGSSIGPAYDGTGTTVRTTKIRVPSMVRTGQLSALVRHFWWHSYA